MTCPRNRRRGEAHHSTKLTPWDVVAIRLLLEERVAKRSIGRAFGIARKTVRAIDLRLIWKWL